MNTKETQQVMENKMVSIYDYLGKAAGPTLGKHIFEIAIKKRIPMSSKEVSNPKYKGKIMMYPYVFLDDYFNSRFTCL
jgi:hypothetical protein